MMLAYLSPAWVEAMDHAVQADARLAEAVADLTLVVEQRVSGGPLGDVTYHVSFDHGHVRVAPGPAVPGDTPIVRFSLDHDTAMAIADGSGSAQRAFMAGALHVGGDLRVLLDHTGVLSVLHDVFEAVRAQTDLAPAATDA